jgi:hypothetical protein
MLLVLGTPAGRTDLLYRHKGITKGQAPMAQVPQRLGGLTPTDPSARPAVSALLE